MEKKHPTRGLRFRVTCVQLNAGSDWERNLKRSYAFAEAACRDAEVVALPENFLWRGASRDYPEVSTLGSRKALSLFSQLAARYKTHILLGSLAMPSRRDRYYNTSFWISDRGKIAARYHKIHLFDVALPKVQVRESKYFDSGKNAVTLNIRKGITAGLSICYDLRFPELYRRLSDRGANLLFVPANFTYETGKAHWETLLKARAIENQSFVAAPAQVGVSPSSGIRSFGHSMIVSPWGDVLACGNAASEGLVSAELDFAYLRTLRSRFPALRHRTSHL